MQQAIVEKAMAGRHALGILPTGTGKSLCYQVPALSRYDKTGALTVVISPLVALMVDRVAGLEERGIGCCVTVNGLLSIPERADALDRVRLGDAGILLISPEQLRSRSLRRVLDQREIGAWVLDEAHCLFEIPRAMLAAARQWGELGPHVPDACANIQMEDVHLPTTDRRRPASRPAAPHPGEQRAGAASAPARHDPVGTSRAVGLRLTAPEPALRSGPCSADLCGVRSRRINGLELP